jgi:hypothetical protein
LFHKSIDFLNFFAVYWLLKELKGGAMKKMFLASFLVFFSAIAVYSQVGVIRDLIGDVELKHPGFSNFVPARAGIEVAQETIISTGFRSTATITIGSNTITVRPLTRLTLAEISSSSGVENLSVNLETGRIRVDVKPPAGTRANTTVQSPSATASVRGTVFDVDTNNISVHEGSVGYTGKDGLSTIIGQGFSGTTGLLNNTLNSLNSAFDNIMPSEPIGSGLAGESGGSIGVGIGTSQSELGTIEIRLWGTPGSR